jgi:membrane peptidoglycan carboxypeptidase
MAHDEAGRTEATLREEQLMMRRYCRAVGVLLVAAAMPAGSALAQTGFNGVITFVNEGSAGKQDTFVQYTKGHKVRLDGFGSQRGAMIVDNDAKVMMMVDPEKKQYMTMTEEDAKQMQAMMGPMMERMKQQQSKKADAGAKVSFAKTGKTETVAGVPCEVYRGEYVEEDGDKDEGEACVATGVGFALDALTFNNPMVQRGGAGYDRMQQFRDLVGGNKGILKAKSFQDGKVKTDMEAIKIERKSPGDDMFTPPAGYKEIRMADMMMQAHNAMKGMKTNPGQGDPQYGRPDTKQGQGEPQAEPKQ